MVRTQLYLPEETYAALKAAAKKKGISFAAYVRNLVDKDVLESKKEKTVYERYPFIGMFSGGTENASDNKGIDDFLYGTEQGY